MSETDQQWLTAGFGITAQGERPRIAEGQKRIDFS